VERYNKIVLAPCLDLGAPGWRRAVLRGTGRSAQHCVPINSIVRHREYVVASAEASIDPSRPLLFRAGSVAARVLT
jgi:hypothetical protein